MNTNQLDNLLRCLVDTTKCVPAGVFPSDLVPRNFDRFPTCFIVNIDPSSRPGQHWVAYYFDSPFTYEFFDSFGFDPSIYSLHYASPTSYNTHSLQSINSAVCGQFCLYYLHCKCRGTTFDAILHSFSMLSSKWNDKLVRKFIQRITHPKKFYSHPFKIVQVCCSFNHVRKQLIK